MKEIKLYKSKWKNLGLFLGCSVFVFGGIYFISDKYSDLFKIIIGWVSILFFGLGVLVAFYNLLDWRPQIIINEIGIYDRTILKEFINWNIIENAYLVDTGVKFICVSLKSGIDIKKSQSKFSKKISSINKAMGFEELNINLSSIKIDEKRLTEFIIEMSKAKPTERNKLFLDFQ